MTFINLDSTQLSSLPTFSYVVSDFKQRVGAIAGDMALRWLPSFKVRSLYASAAVPAIAFVALAGCSNTADPLRIIGVTALAALSGLFLARSLVGSPSTPFTDLALAADRFDLREATQRIPENLPLEGSHAAKAFNDMSERVARQFQERVQLLSAFSHDVRTPITRMRLRIELADDFPEKEKMLRDLSEAERLIRDGIAYARSSHLAKEENVNLDIRSFVECVAYDYLDTGRDVSATGVSAGTASVKPAALRRILSNFIDNSLKFAGSAEIRLSKTAGGRIAISVLDEGPGIDEDKLALAQQPFVKLHTGDETKSGVGLGLAIAKQLAEEMGASILLENRAGGGLAATIVLKA